MSETIRVIITAVETVRLERMIDIPKERYAKYKEMVERGADEVELTLVCGDLLRESPDVADSLGLEDLKIIPALRASFDAGARQIADQRDWLTKNLYQLDELIARSIKAQKSNRALIERSMGAVQRSRALIEQGMVDAVKPHNWRATQGLRPHDKTHRDDD
jgi:hypothetical protein